MFPARFSQEIKQINKKRTFGLAGFLLILTFFPVVFSSNTTQTQESVLAAQDSDIRANQQISQQPSLSPSQQQAAPQSAVLSVSPAPTISVPVQEEAYSPQPSIWLFIIPIVITFFTILFY